MSSHQCTALTTPDTLWSFCPSIGAAYAFTVFFGLSCVVHIAQGIYHRKAYTWVIAMSALWQTIAYSFRVVSINTPASYGNYAAWFVLILVAPLWTNAFVYMVMGRMVWNFTQQAKVFGISAWRFTSIFVVLDIVAFVIQVYGAASASGSNIPDKEVLKYLHVYMGGVGLQQLFILVFLVYAFGFHRIIIREGALDRGTKRRAMILLYTLYTCLALITMRIVFRICEYSKGLTSTIPNHEAYQYCLDSLPMLLALVLLNVFHPGRLMPGTESNIPSRKERKAGVRAKAAPSTGLQEAEYKLIGYQGNQSIA